MRCTSADLGFCDLTGSLEPPIIHDARVRARPLCTQLASCEQVDVAPRYMFHAARLARPIRTIVLVASLLCATRCTREKMEAGPAPVARDTNEPRTEPAVPECMKRGGPIERDTTLTRACSPYLLTGGIDVIKGATLTIEAGVEVRFEDGDWLEIGATGRPGRLIARGTPEQPIVLHAADPDITHPKAPNKPATWFGVWFHSGTLEGSVLSHAVISQGGGVNAHLKPPLAQGCITLTGVRPGVLQLDHIQTRNCLIGAFVMSESHARATDLTFEDSPAGFVADAQSIGTLTAAAVYRNVSQNIITGGDVATDASWVSQGVPYVVQGDVRVGGVANPTLTLQPGIALQFANGIALSIGATEPGRLNAHGTAAARVAFTSNVAGGGWKGITFDAQTSDGSALDFADVSHATGDAAVSILTQPGHVSTRNTRFANNSADVVIGCNANPALKNNEYRSEKKLVRRSCR
jgi:hypothetical protein